MIKVEDRCVGCPPYMCIGKACGKRDVEVLYCDKCGGNYDVEENSGESGEDLCFFCRIKEDDG